MPFCDEAGVVREVTVTCVPQEPLQVFAVILDGSGTFTLGDFGEEEGVDERFERRASHSADG